VSSSWFHEIVRHQNDHCYQCCKKQTAGSSANTHFRLFKAQHAHFLLWGQNFDVSSSVIDPKKLLVLVYEIICTTFVQVTE
jgi:hypothetical protein